MIPAEAIISKQSYTPKALHCYKYWYYCVHCYLFLTLVWIIYEWMAITWGYSLHQSTGAIHLRSMIISAFEVPSFYLLAFQAERVLSVCPSVYLSVKLYFVCTITRHKFMVGSPNLYQTFILVYSQSVLKMRVIYFDLQGHMAVLTLISKNQNVALVTDLGCPRDITHPKRVLVWQTLILCLSVLLLDSCMSECPSQNDWAAEDQDKNLNLTVCPYVDWAFSPPLPDSSWSIVIKKDTSCLPL